MKTRAGIPDLEDIDDGGNVSHAKSDGEKANLFQKYFGGVYTKEPDGDMPYFEEREYNEILSNLNVTEETIMKKLKKIKINKSPGPDSIHPRVLREISNEICTPLKIILNLSLQTMTLPDDWKHAHVTAIFKKRCKN